MLMYRESNRRILSTRRGFESAITVQKRMHHSLDRFAYKIASERACRAKRTKDKSPF
jgi:hypothetical protein